MRRGGKHAAQRIRQADDNDSDIAEYKLPDPELKRRGFQLGTPPSSEAGPIYLRLTIEDGLEDGPYRNSFNQSVVLKH